MHCRGLLVLSCVAMTIAAIGACGTPQAPARAAEAPMEPLVIGRSPPAAAVDEDAPPRDAARDSSPDPRDPRSMKARRTRVVLVDELDHLLAFLATFQRNDPGRAPLLRQIAEDYAELERVAEGPLVKIARKKALERYDSIVAECPQYPAIDEVLYYSGLEHELDGDGAAARRSYFLVVQRTPSSKLVPFAYFAFGEMFLSEGSSDPSKLELALQAFREALKFPSPGNTIYPEALLRVGQVLEKRGDATQAAAAYARLQREHPNSEAALKIPGRSSATPPAAPLRRP